jgi:hypothetical protein
MLDDVYGLRERARQATIAGQHDVALRALLAAASETQIPEEDYVAVLRPLAETYLRCGDPRSALTVQWYLAAGQPPKYAALEPLFDRVPPVDRGRTRAAAGDLSGAAREMEEAGLMAAAAVHREHHGDWRGARALWSRLAQVKTLTVAGPYPEGLVYFNLSRCAKQCGEARQARDALLSAVRLTEEAADRFESAGQRERAFDCFQVLVQIGREGGMFENVLEGFVNCIRILREDHLKYFALQYLEDAISLSRQHGEFSAAATLAREASEYARSIGLGPTGVHYALVQAELWQEVARSQLSRGGPAEVAENALLAAVLAFGEAGQFQKVGQLYTDLAHLELEERQRAHYARAAVRYQQVKDPPLEASPLPAHLRQDHHFPDVWHVDLLEWEQDGSAAEATADVLLDVRWPEMTRRSAMLARLTALAVESRPDAAPSALTAARERLAAELAQLQLYAVLSPLEKLFATSERSSRIAVLNAMRTLYFKRSFVTLRSALLDLDPGVVEAAALAVEGLSFPHAFDPLARIVREASSPSVRAHALSALSRIDTIEAAEFLFGVLEHGPPSDRRATLDALKRSRGSRFLELAQASLRAGSAELQSMLHDIVRSRRAA